MGNWTGLTSTILVRYSKARKRYLCWACGEEIPKGEEYVSYMSAWSITYNPETSIERYHLKCSYKPALPLQEIKKRREILGVK